MEFLKKLGHMDLDKLLNIANDLSWFANIKPERFKDKMAKLLGEDVATKICSYVPDSGHLSAVLAHDFRNQLHATRCVREPFELEDSTGIFAGLCLILAVYSFGERSNLSLAQFRP